MPEKRDDIPGEQVEYLASIGCTQQEIADLYGVHKSTISRSFATEYSKGKARVKKKLREIQWAIAEKGNATMAIFLGKNTLGQSDFGMNDEEDELPPYSE